MKKDCEEKIKRLEVSLSEVRVQKSNTASIDQMVLKAIEALSNFKKLYADGDTLTKRAILVRYTGENCDLTGTAIEPSGRTKLRYLSFK